MCELLAMSSSAPVSVSLSFEELARHGAGAGAYHDGWGVAYYQSRDVRLLKDTEAAGASDWLRFVQAHRLRSTLVVAHIRRAVRGGVSFENTQPFVRELGGRAHVFAHNGALAQSGLDPLSVGRFRPMGATDSELAFCALLDRLEPLWEAADLPPLTERTQVVAEFARAIRSLGPANFLYADGDALFAHGHRRRHAGEEGTRPPGLRLLHRTCPPHGASLAGGGVRLATEADGGHVTLIASVPLTDESWEQLGEGELAVAVRGRIVERVTG